MKKLAFAFTVFATLLTAGTVAAEAANFNAFQLQQTQAGNGSPDWHDGGR